MLQLVHSRTTVQLARRLKTTISSIKRGNPLLGRKFMKNFSTYPYHAWSDDRFSPLRTSVRGWDSESGENKRLKRIHRAFEWATVKPTDGRILVNSQEAGAS